MNAPSAVVGRVGVVLRAVADREPGGATTSEVSRATDLARPTAHRLLASLLDEGLLDRDERGRWLLGPELYLFGTAASSRYDVTTAAQPFVRRLAVATGDSAFFSVRRGDETVCLLREDGSFPIRSHVLYEGIRFPLGVASAGLAILSHLPAAESAAYLDGADLTEAFGPSHAADVVRERMELTRETGYAVNPGLIVTGSWGLGAAVFDTADRAQWALTLTGVEQRFGEARRRELGAMLLDAAHELTTVLRRRARLTRARA